MSEGEKIKMKNESEGTLIKVTNEAEARKIQLILEVPIVHLHLNLHLLLIKASYQRQLEIDTIPNYVYSYVLDSKC